MMVAKTEPSRLPRTSPIRTNACGSFDFGAISAKRQRWPRVSITLEIDGEAVADQSHLQPVTEFPQSRDCVRLGSAWRDSQQRPLPCSHGVLWRYLHVPLSPGEHNWTFSATYTDGEDGQESFDERYSGIITTTVGIGPSQ